MLSSPTNRLGGQSSSSSTTTLKNTAWRHCRRLAFLAPARCKELHVCLICWHNHSKVKLTWVNQVKFRLRTQGMPDLQEVARDTTWCDRLTRRVYNSNPFKMIPLSACIAPRQSTLVAQLQLQSPNCSYYACWADMNYIYTNTPFLHITMTGSFCCGLAISYTVETRENRCTCIRLFVGIY